MLFPNKSILFTIDINTRYCFPNYPYLLILNDEYIPKSCIDDDLYNNLRTRNLFMFKGKTRKY